MGGVNRADLARVSNAAATPSSSARERLLAIGVTAVAVLLPLAMYAAPYRPHYSAQFVAAWGSAFFLCVLFACVIQIWLARVVGDVASARLAAALAYCVPLVGLDTASFTDITPAAASWAFHFWYIGWTLMLVWYARSPRGRGNLSRNLIAAAAAGFIIAAVAFLQAFPPMISGPGESFTATFRAVSALRLVLDAAAILALLFQRPLRSLNLWLAASIVLLALSTGFSSVSSSRLSDMLQLARIAVLESCIIVVCALLSELARMLQRSSLMERFMLMAESAATIVYLLDAGGAVTYMNRRWTEVTGQPIPEALGDGWRKMLHPEDLRRNASARQKCMMKKEPYRVEQRYRQADGEYRWFISSATAVADVDGKLAWYGTVTDVDAEHRALETVAALYEREQRVSKMLQSAFLPSFLPEIEGLSLQGVYRPAVHEAEVGGDWYDVFTLRDGRLAISIGDVFGHGLEAATAMVRLRETLRAVTAFTDSDPGLVLQTANRVFMPSHPEEIASAVFAIYDPATRILSVASAGHPPPALLRKGLVSFFPSGSSPLGVDAQATYTVENLILERQDTIAFYTDGLTEVDRDCIEGERRFADLLLEYSDDPERLVDEALRGRQRDDVALLTLGVVHTGAGASWHFKSDDAASAQAARSAFTAHLRLRSVDPGTVIVAELVFGELVGNVVRHAPGPIEVELFWRGELPLIVVRDRGPSFEIGEIALPNDALTEHGRGLYLVSRFASRPLVTPRPGGGNEVVVEITTTLGSPGRTDLLTA